MNGGDLAIGVPETHLVLPGRKRVDELDVVELPETDKDRLEDAGEGCYAVGKRSLQVDNPSVEVPAGNAGEGRMLELKRRLSSSSAEPTVRTRTELHDDNL
jgi:hypothetical protein